MRRFTGRMDMKFLLAGLAHSNTFANLLALRDFVVESRAGIAQHREVEMQREVRVVHEVLWNHLRAFIVAMLAATALVAQDLPTAKPESVGLSSERLERITGKVQQTI